MTVPPGRLRLGDSLDRGGWLFALLLLLILVPAGVVLWFTNEAVTTQSAAARRTVLESYRGQLRLVRARVDSHWRTHAALLDGAEDPERRFATLIVAGTADAAVLLAADGSVLYPSDGASGSARARAIDQQLRAAEQSRAGAARDAQVSTIAAALNDYSGALTGAERLAYMERLRRVAPNVRIPTEAALRLSLAMARNGARIAASGHFQQTPVRDLWSFGSDDGRVVAFYWTGRLEALMHDLLHQVTPAGIRFLAFPPDIDADPEAIAAGPAMPGWQLSFHALDMTPFDTAARRQGLVYVYVAAAGIALIVIVGAVAARAFRRHLQLARLKTDLVAAVSHELRTPVASMRVLLDGLLDDEVLDAGKTRDYLALLSAENARLSRVVENFLAFSRLERGRQQFVFAPASAVTIVDTAVAAVRERIPAGTEFRVAIEPDLPPVVADADALATALVNLLDNALKYTPADKQITLRVTRDGATTVVFAVGDNGIGIPTREQRRIFRRFYRVDQHLTRQTSGVGLGLSIVALIARAHGGSIGVESERGKGSVFALRVPAAPAGAAV